MGVLFCFKVGCLCNNGKEVHPHGQSSINGMSRKQALKEIKRDLGIINSQQPSNQRMVPLLDEKGNRILENKKVVYSRAITYDVKGKYDLQGNPITKVVI